MTKPRLTPELLVERLVYWQKKGPRRGTTTRRYPWIACFADDLDDGPLPQGFRLEWRTGGRVVVAFADSGPTPGELDALCNRQRAIDTAKRLKGGSRSNMVPHTFALLIGGKNRCFTLERKGDDWIAADTGLLTWMKNHLWPSPMCGNCDRYRRHQSRNELCPALDAREGPGGGFASPRSDFVVAPGFDFFTAQLASCPFCGGEAFPDVDGLVNDYAVACRGCEARGPAKAGTSASRRKSLMSEMWWDKTCSPATGCTPVSPGCDHCWAKRTAENRLRGRFGYPSDEPFRVTLHPERIEELLRGRKRQRIFLNSMGDLFHDDVPDAFLDSVWAALLLNLYHTAMVLTKRPERALRYLDDDGLYDRVLRAAGEHRRKRPELMGIGISDPKRHPPKWIWLGVTAEDQQRADERIPVLLQVPAAVRFVSVEPMIGPVDLHRWTAKRSDGVGLCCECCFGDRCDEPRHVHRTSCKACNGTGVRDCSVDWVICGGETGPGARPMDLEWVRSLRDQCQSAGVPFFFKHVGQRRETPLDLDIHEYPEVRLLGAPV